MQIDLGVKVGCVGHDCDKCQNTEGLLERYLDLERQVEIVVKLNYTPKLRAALKSVQDYRKHINME